MNEFNSIMQNASWWCAFAAWALAQVLKVPFYALVSKRIDWSRLLNAGGMPSSHTATCVAIATSIAMTEGFGSPMFTVASGLSIIVMYDATGVRRAAGNHARVLNEIIQAMQHPDSMTDDKLKEWLGHTPFEVAMGALLGIVVALIVTPMFAL